MKIHLIERLHNFKKVNGQIWESGWWDISPSTATILKGGEIYFHYAWSCPR